MSDLGNLTEGLHPDAVAPVILIPDMDSRARLEIGKWHAQHGLAPHHHAKPS